MACFSPSKLLLFRGTPASVDALFFHVRSSLHANQQATFELHDDLTSFFFAFASASSTQVSCRGSSVKAKSKENRKKRAEAKSHMDGHVSASILKQVLGLARKWNDVFAISGFRLSPSLACSSFSRSRLGILQSLRCWFWFSMRSTRFAISLTHQLHICKSEKKKTHKLEIFHPQLDSPLFSYCAISRHWSVAGAKALFWNFSIFLIDPEKLERHLKNLMFVELSRDNVTVARLMEIEKLSKKSLFFACHKVRAEEKE